MEQKKMRNCVLLALFVAGIDEKWEDGLWN